MTYENRYIVKLKPLAPIVNLTRFGEIGNPQSMSELIILKSNFAKKDIEALAEVEYVEEDSDELPVEDNWFRSAVAVTHPIPDNFGLGVDIYLIDSGIRETHTDFTGRVTTIFSFDGQPYSDDTYASEHGTMTASCAAGSLYGVATGARIYSARVDWKKSTTLKALDAVLNHHLQKENTYSVLSMSFASDESSAAREYAINKLLDAGVVCVAAAGNSRADIPYYPAGYSGVVSVAAFADNYHPAPFTNYGESIDIFAPGYNGVAASTVSDTATREASGTSAACPIVAGCIAGYMVGFLAPTNREEVSQIVSSYLSKCPENVNTWWNSKYANTTAKTAIVIPPPKAAEQPKEQTTEQPNKEQPKNIIQRLINFILNMLKR